jgi:hypothetical protein
MAKGRCGFLRVPSEFMEHYNLIEQVAINALPNVNANCHSAFFLIENPKK